MNVYLEAALWLVCGLMCLLLLAGIVGIIIINAGVFAAPIFFGSFLVGSVYLMLVETIKERNRRNGRS